MGGGRGYWAFHGISPSIRLILWSGMRARVSDQDTDQIRTAGDATGRQGLVWLGLTNQLTVAVAPALEVVANALADATRAGGAFQTSIRFLGDNIGRISSITSVFACLVAGRWVAATAAAALGVRRLATALVILRSALIRTGIGALIVGAGELVYQLSKLVEGAGGFGAALGLLKDLAREVWDRIGLGVDAVVASLRASWYGITATVADTMQGALVAVVGFGNSATGVFQGAFDAVKAIWSALPSAIGDFAFQAANGLIGGVEAMLNGVVTRINTFINGLNAALALLPDWATGEGGIQIGTIVPVTLGRVDNPFEGAATAAGAAAADAFNAAMGQTYLEAPDLGLGTMASDARDRSAAYTEASGMLTDAATRPLASWQALSDAMTSAGTDGASALDGVLGATMGDLFAPAAVAAPVMHSGGMVGGFAPMRAVPVMAFAGAPRMHSGGFAGLRPDEVPAILQKGERVLSRRETAGYGAAGNVSITIQTRDAESFRQSRTQVASDIARAVSLGRRGM